MLDYKGIITKRYVLHMALRDIAKDTGGSKSGIGDFLRAFENCKELSVPLPTGITNEGIALSSINSSMRICVFVDTLPIVGELLFFSVYLPALLVFSTH